ncbi:MAG: DUF456 domain-containing protein [Spirochaetales bacterium]|nr:MAG: DUF456 domain-containing protein [Spirochaetales bacterium]
MNIVLVTLGFITATTGLIGCVVPVLPGPILSYAALILISIVKKWQAFSPLFLVIMGVITVAATVLDNFIPVLVSKRKGASKAGIWGSIIGLVAGMFIFPPFGMIIGTFVGAVAGELIFNKEKKNALKAGWGVFLGTLLSIMLKVGVSGSIYFFFVRALLRK